MDKTTPFMMEIVLRAAAALPGAGAWDAVPLEASVQNCDGLTLYLSYTRGAAGGGFDFQLQASPRLINDGTLQNWYPPSVYAAGVLAAGADTQSRLQREYATYQATGAAIETAIYGPIRLARNVARVRLLCRESGVPATPGTVHVSGVLGY